MKNFKRGSTSYNSSWCLPQDTWKEILAYLNHIEVARIALTCKFFNELNEKKANGKCYMFIAVPKEVTSPEDFMEKVLAFKESRYGLIRFGNSILHYGPYQSRAECQLFMNTNCNGA